nr:protein FAR1-RELATED SEQUENCE 5-like [Ipomoea batatas]
MANRVEAGDRGKNTLVPNGDISSGSRSLGSADTYSDVVHKPRREPFGVQKWKWVPKNSLAPTTNVQNSEGTREEEEGNAQYEGPSSAIVSENGVSMQKDGVMQKNGDSLSNEDKEAMCVPNDSQDVCPNEALKESRVVGDENPLVEGDKDAMDASIMDLENVCNTSLDLKDKEIDEVEEGGAKDDGNTSCDQECDNQEIPAFGVSGVKHNQKSRKKKKAKELPIADFFKDLESDKEGGSKSSCKEENMEAIELFEDDNNMVGEGNVMAEENIVPAPNDDVGDQEFISACAKANIGTSKEFELYAELTGGFDKVGATCVDFRNCKRDVNAYLHEADAQAVVDKYRKKQLLFPTYTFEYETDDEQQLRGLFWTDPIAKENYQRFGDMVSFDATYSTNRYNMVFVPFTGIDNNKKCVTFGAGLISKENKESYVWLLNAFKRCMGHIPASVITDQDPAMKEVIPQSFPDTRHRFCMWHIMTKVNEKVGVKLAKDEIFWRKLNAVVWDETLGLEEFLGGD